MAKLAATMATIQLQQTMTRAGMVAVLTRKMERKAGDRSSKAQGIKEERMVNRQMVIRPL